MKKLEKFGVQELDAVEVQSIEGGKIPWKRLIKWGNWLMNAAGVYDAIEDFNSGWADGAAEYECCE